MRYVLSEVNKHLKREEDAMTFVYVHNTVQTNCVFTASVRRDTIMVTVINSSMHTHGKNESRGKMRVVVAIGDIL